MLRRRLEQLKQAAPAAEGSKSEVRRAPLEEDDENAKTKFVEPTRDDPPGQNDPPLPKL